MAAGRPTTYDAEKIALDVNEYVKDAHRKNFLPTVEGLAVHLCVGRATIYRWAEEHDEFRDILEQLLAAQASQLIQNGLVNNYNSTITKLILTKHGYSDKQEIDHTSKGERVAGFNFVSNEGGTTDNQANA